MSQFRGSGHHGSLFHLANIAFYHFSHKVNSSMPKLHAIEDSIETPLFIEPGKEFGDEPIIRRSDIVLSDSNNNLILVELKSYKRRPTNSGFKLWGIGKERTCGADHREYFLDRANVAQDVEGVNDDITGMQWRFHKFNAKSTSKSDNVSSQEGFTREQLHTKNVRLGSVAARLETFPTASSTEEPVVFHSLGMSEAEYKAKKAQHDKRNGKASDEAKAIVDVQDIETWFLDNAATLLPSFEAAQ